MTMAIARRVRFARALGSRQFALLWGGQTVSSLGDGAFLTAMAWQVLELTNSGTAMGAVLAAGAVPRVLFLLLGGVAADRLPRRLVMLWSDVGRAVAVGAVALLGMTQLLDLWHLLALSALFGIASAFFMPAYQSIPPQLVDAERLPSANALSGLSRQLSTLLGPPLGAAFVAAFTSSGAFLFDGLTFVVSALCLLWLRVPPRARPNAAPDGGTADGSPLRGPRRMLADVREGLAYVTRSPWLWVTIAVASLMNVGAAPFQVALPKLISDVYHQGVWLLGAVGTAVAAGSILATLIIGQAKRLPRRGLLAYGALLLGNLAVIAFGLPLPRETAPFVALGAAATFGLGLGVFEIIWVTVLQELVPADTLGRVTSIDWLGSLALMPVGLTLVGVLTDRIGASQIFLAGGALNVALVLLALTARGIRELR